MINYLLNCVTMNQAFLMHPEYILLCVFYVIRVSVKMLCIN